VAELAKLNLKSAFKSKLSLEKLAGKLHGYAQENGGIWQVGRIAPNLNKFQLELIRPLNYRPGTNDPAAKNAEEGLRTIMMDAGHGRARVSSIYYYKYRDKPTNHGVQVNIEHPKVHELHTHLAILARERNH
jgi:hypothetical protein